MSSSNCCFLTCIQISQEASQVVWYSHLFQNFPQFIVIHTSQRLWHSQSSRSRCFSGTLAFLMIQRMLEIWSLVPLPFLKPAWTSGISWFTYCWSLCLENFEHYFTSMWDEWNCVVVWTFFGTAFFLGMEWKLPISSPVATAEFSKFAGILSAALLQHHISGFDIAQLEFHHLY